ncbi:hypothetical protein [Marinivivus vitaminiproducens]|uniref:hypothetical protein n=1 Tax=Marinivivus vitaminiproducens TaxID=3035935 RepID=UPI0027A8D11C|nr:hypothetical protein P4R82_07680 [Geminicoccaceae bacterium SCSIO 64248]
MADQDYRLEFERRGTRQTPTGASSAEWAKLIHDGLAMHSGRQAPSTTERPDAHQRATPSSSKRSSTGRRSGSVSLAAGAARRRARVAPSTERGRAFKQAAGLTASMLLATALVFGAGYMLSQHDDSSALEDRVTALGIDLNGQPAPADQAPADPPPAPSAIEASPEVADSSADIAVEEAIAANPVGAARSLIPQLSADAGMPAGELPPQTDEMGSDAPVPSPRPSLMNEMSIEPSAVHLTSDGPTLARSRPVPPTL